MIKLKNSISKKYKIRNFLFGNNNLERFSSYGMFYILFCFVIFILNLSHYSYFNENIKYIFWANNGVLFIAFISVIYNYYFKLNIKDLEVEFPKEIHVGEKKLLKNLKYKNGSKYDYIYLRFKIKNFNNLSNLDHEEMKLIENNSHEKWRNNWNYGGNMGYNLYSIMPIDFSQENLNSKNIEVFGKKRGRVIIEGFYLYTFDIFGLFRVKKFISLKNKPILNILPSKKENKESNLKTIDKIISNNGFLTNANIIGIKKAKLGESARNTHWKIFAKKEDHWSFVKEKENKKPALIWVDTSIKDLKNRSEQFEVLISDLLFTINKGKVDYIIMSNRLYCVKKEMQLIKNKLSEIPFYGEDNFDVDCTLFKDMNIILGVSVNQKEENKQLEKINNYLNSKGKKIKMVIYDQNA